MSGEYDTMGKTAVSREGGYDIATDRTRSPFEGVSGVFARILPEILSQVEVEPWMLVYVDLLARWKAEKTEQMIDDWGVNKVITEGERLVHPDVDRQLRRKAQEYSRLVEEKARAIGVPLEDLEISEEEFLEFMAQAERLAIQE